MDQITIQKKIAEDVKKRFLPAMTVNVDSQLRKGYSFQNSDPTPDWTQITVTVLFAEGETEVRPMLTFESLDRHNLYGIPYKGALETKYHARIIEAMRWTLGANGRDQYERLETGEQLTIDINHVEMTKFVDRALAYYNFKTPNERASTKPPSFSKLKRMGLVDASSSQQVRNKTHAWYDPETDCFLRFYRNGTSVKLATYSSQWNNYKDERALVFDCSPAIGMEKALEVLIERRRKAKIKNKTNITLGRPVILTASYHEIRLPKKGEEIPEGRGGFAHMDRDCDVSFGRSPLPI